MAISFVISTSVGSPDSQGGTTPPIDTTGGNFCCIVLGDYEPATTGVSDNKGNSYSGLTRYSNSGDNTIKIFYAANATCGTNHTFSFSEADVQFGSIAVLVFSGVLTVSPFDQQNGSAGTSGTTKQPGSITPSENDELLITGLSLNGTFGSLAVNGGFTLQEQVAYSAGLHYGIGAAYLIQTSAAAANPQWSWTTSRLPAADIASFKATAGGGGGNPWYAYAQQRRQTIKRSWQRSGLLWTPSYALGKVA